MLSLGKRSHVESDSKKPQKQHFELAGSLTRQAEVDSPLATTGGGGRDSSAVAASHIGNLGRLIEDMESKMRNQILDVYFGKTKDVLGMLRSTESLETMRREQDLRKELMGMWKR